jgi:hypothetical protein
MNVEFEHESAVERTIWVEVVRIVTPLSTCDTVVLRWTFAKQVTVVQDDEQSRRPSASPASSLNCTG